MDRPSRRSVPLGAALCDRLCFPSSSALRERLAADDDRRRRSGGGTGLLSMAAASLETGAGVPEGREPTRGDVLKLAWPHVSWLVFGCIALACRLPFSVAMPHFVSAVIGAVGEGDAEEARRAIVWFFVLGVADSVGDFFCAFLFSYCQCGPSPCPSSPCSPPAPTLALPPTTGSGQRR